MKELENACIRCHSPAAYLAGGRAPAAGDSEEKSYSVATNRAGLQGPGGR